jgi:hypothetical protein
MKAPRAPQRILKCLPGHPAWVELPSAPVFPGIPVILGLQAFPGTKRKDIEDKPDLACLHSLSREKVSASWERGEQEADSKSEGHGHLRELPALCSGTHEGRQAWPFPR